LEVVADNSIDFCFSFDALVHVELDIIGSYCKQLLNKLSPTGVAFIHHSNAHKDHDPEKPDLHWRAPSVSSDLVKQIIESNGGSVLVQEEVNWLTTYRIDCFTTFMKRNYINQPYKLLLNNQFMEEVELIKKYQSHYH